MKTILIIVVFLITVKIAFSQTTYSYDENGNLTARIIDLGKDIEPK